MRAKIPACAAALALCAALLGAAAPAAPMARAEMAPALLAATGDAPGRWRYTFSPWEARAEAYSLETGETFRLRWEYRDGAWQLVCVQRFGFG